MTTKTTYREYRKLPDGEVLDEYHIVTRGEDRRRDERRKVDTSVEDIKRQLRNYEREIYTLRSHLECMGYKNDKV